MYATGSSQGSEPPTVTEFKRGRPPATVTPAYNLFRYRSAPDLLCAVPEERPVPSFLDGRVWAYAGTLQGTDPPPSGFLRTEAEVGAWLNGFYLFEAIGRTAREASSAASEPAPRSGRRAPGPDRFYPPQPRSFEDLLALTTIIGARRSKRPLS
jgi:hypothetical protein